MEVQSREGGAGLLQFADQKGPTFLSHGDGPELTDIEGQRPPAPLVAVVRKAWQTRDREEKAQDSNFKLRALNQRDA